MEEVQLDLPFGIDEDFLDEVDAQYTEEDEDLQSLLDEYNL
jgi:hypothetical protein